MTAIADLVRAAIARAPAPPTYGEVLAELASHRLAPAALADRASPASREAAAALERAIDAAEPRAVRALVGFGTWLGAALIAVVLAALDMFRNPGVAGIFGASLLVAAALVRRGVRGVIGSQLTLVCGIGGQALVLIAVGSRSDGDRTIPATIVALQAIAIAAIPDPLHRALSAAAGTIAAAFLAYALEVGGGVDGVAVIAGAYVLVAWLYESRLAASRFAAAIRPVASGLVVGLVGILAADAVARGGSSTHPILASPALVTGAFGGLLLAVVGTALVELRRPYLGAPGLVALAATALVGALTWRTPGLLASLFILALARLRGERALERLGVLALAGFLVGAFALLGVEAEALPLVLAGPGAVLVAVGVVALRAGPLESSRTV